MLVGLDLERLVAVLGDFAAQLGDGCVVLAAGSFVGFDCGLSFLQLRLSACKFLLDDGNPPGEFGDLILQTTDFLVGVLQFPQILYFRKH